MLAFCGRPLLFNQERMSGVGCGSPAACGHQGAPLRWWAWSQRSSHRRGSVLEGRLQQLGSGTTSDPGTQFGESSRPLTFGLTRPHSRGCLPSGPLGPSCKAKCGLGILQLMGPRQRPGHSQAQLSHQPSQPSLSLGSPISSGARVPAAPVPHGLLNPSGPAIGGPWTANPSAEGRV